MGEKLTWKEIEKLYDQQRVELVDYDWAERDPYPRAGVVQSRGSDKKEFYRQCNREPVAADSAILFVGVYRLPEGTVFSPSLIRVEPCEK